VGTNKHITYFLICDSHSESHCKSHSESHCKSHSESHCESTSDSHFFSEPQSQTGLKFATGWNTSALVKMIIHILYL